jgi:hypothetical protein
MGVLMVKCPTSGREFSTGFKSKKTILSGFPRLWPSHAARTAEGTTFGGPESPVLLRRAVQVEGSKRRRELRAGGGPTPGRIVRAQFGPVANEVLVNAQQP